MSSQDASLHVFTCGGSHAAFSGGHTFLTYPIPHVIDLSSPPLHPFPIFQTPPHPIPLLPLAVLPLLGLFTIYSTRRHHLSLMSSLFPSLPSRLSNRGVIVSRRITADKSILSFFHLFSPPLSPSSFLFLLPHYIGLLNLKTRAGQWGPNEHDNLSFSSPLLLTPSG